MVKKNILVCIDRDGTLMYDGGSYHLGRQKNWKSMVKVLRGSISAIKELRKIDLVKIFMVTNQPGVAITNFPLLTRKKALEVCEYFLEILKSKGAAVDGFEMCGKSSIEYYNNRKDRYTFDMSLVGKFACAKPRAGMISNILKELKWKKSETSIYVLGDRLSDVKTGLAIDGIGIYVPFSGKEEEVTFVKQYMKRYPTRSGKIYVSDGIVDAARYVVRQELHKNKK
ncbi:MAG: histidinol phosphatase-like enzyme [Patescibacteria group bacterium]|jgi:histidinol phosphatase-like enzyme